MLIHVLRRAKELVLSGEDVFCSPALKYFLENNINSKDFKSNPEVLDLFAQLDDFDILGAIKVWQNHNDKVLSELSQRLIQRKLFKIKVSKKPFTETEINKIKKEISSKLSIDPEDSKYFVYSDKLINSAYNDMNQHINLLMKSGDIVEVSKASDHLNISALAEPVEKYFICYPVFNSEKPKQLSLLKSIK